MSDSDSTLDIRRVARPISVTGRSSMATLGEVVADVATLRPFTGVLSLGVEPGSPPDVDLSYLSLAPMVVNQLESGSDASGRGHPPDQGTTQADQTPDQRPDSPADTDEQLVRDLLAQEHEAEQRASTEASDAPGDDETDPIRDIRSSDTAVDPGQDGITLEHEQPLDESPFNHPKGRDRRPDESADVPQEPLDTEVKREPHSRDDGASPQMDAPADASQGRHSEASREPTTGVDDGSTDRLHREAPNAPETDPARDSDGRQRSSRSNPDLAPDRTTDSAAEPTRDQRPGQAADRGETSDPTHPSVDSGDGRGPAERADDLAEQPDDLGRRTQTDHDMPDLRYEDTPGNSDRARTERPAGDQSKPGELPPAIDDGDSPVPADSASPKPSSRSPTQSSSQSRTQSASRGQPAMSEPPDLRLARTPESGAESNPGQTGSSHGQTGSPHPSGDRSGRPEAEGGLSEQPSSDGPGAQTPLDSRQAAKRQAELLTDAVDVDRLADRLYRQLEDRMRVERERRGLR